MASSLTEIARRLARVERAVRRQQTPQLASSSIEDGAIEGYDQDDNLVLVVGKQFDGTTAAVPYNGPPPPQPTAPIVRAGVKSLAVEWDGFFEGGALVPMDFSRVEVHVSQAPGFTADLADTLKGTIETPRGGGITVTLDTYGVHYVALVARSLSGKASVQSAEASGSPARIEQVDIEDFSITGDKIADFAIAVKKLQSTSHMIY